MSKSDAIVLVEATEIMESLPSAMQRDDQIMDSVIESLQSGISKMEARQDALEIAQLKMGEAMAHGFNLVNDEIKGIKHSAELDRVHASYAQKAAEKAQQIAEHAWQKTQEVAVNVAKAEAKAEGARDLAKNAHRGLGVDPVFGMIGVAIAIIATLALFTRVERQEPKRASDSLPTNAYTCGSSNVSTGGTIDFSKCRKDSEL